MSVNPVNDPRVGAVGASAPASPASRSATPGFDGLLSERMRSGEPAGVRWSSHARDRLAERGITVTPEVAERLDGAVEASAAKGGRESLVLVDQLAFVVSVSNRTVITAVESDALKHRVFTNIDSAVLG
ncbi:MAG: TIGR02530 family flagellar biosynthesis protein [Miltoncostaeaceae bacterium]